MSENYGILEVKEKKSSYSRDARALLLRLANHVKVMCISHKWTIKILEESNFEGRHILGMNVGKRYIKIKLRDTDNRQEFFPYESLLGTLLHELAHMVHSNHSSDFYRLWDALHSELQGTKCIASNNFVPWEGKGCILGGPLRMIEPKTAAGIAAMKRERTGYKFDGAQPLMESKRVAGIAVTTRERTGCVFDCLPPSIEPENSTTMKRQQDPSTSAPPSKKLKIAEIEWSCSLCTYINKPLALICDVCLSTKIDFIDLS